jgi:hypothetical protein
MNERHVLEQRLITLNSLLDGSGHLLGPSGAAMGERLRSAWQAERQLLQRLLAETAGDNVRATIGLWRDRTAAFVQRSAAADAAWTDRSGQRWEATQVLALLDDTSERLDSWAAAAEPLADEEGE